jgi:hypothetical protein
MVASKAETRAGGYSEFGYQGCVLLAEASGVLVRFPDLDDLCPGAHETDDAGEQPSGSRS